MPRLTGALEQLGSYFEAAELAIALTVILAYYRHRESVDGDRMTLLRG